MNTHDMIFKHELFCVGGVTIHGVIGIRDYNELTTYEHARQLYIDEVNTFQMQLGLTDERLLSSKYRINETYKGLEKYYDDNFLYRLRLKLGL